MKDIKTLVYMYHQLQYILNSRQKRKLIVIFLAILCGALLETLGVSVLLPFIQILTNPEELMQKEYVKFFMGLFHIVEVKHVAIIFCIVIILVYLIKNFGLGISMYLLVRYKADLTKELKYQMMQSYMNRPYAYFVDNNSGDILRGVSGDVDSTRSVIDHLFHICTEGLVILSIGIYVIYVDPFLTLGVLLVGILCFGVIVFLLKRKMSVLGLSNRKAEADSYSATMQIMYGIKDIMVRQKRSFFLKKFDNANERTRRAQIGSQFVSALPERIIESICICGIIGIVLIRIAIGIDNENFVPALAVFAVAAFRVLPAISRITGYVNLLIFARPGLEAAYENIKNAREYMATLERTVRDSELSDLSVPSFKEKIWINNISWQYNQANGDVLHNLSLEIKKGESIGIIGESGSGKSTLSDILLGLYRPQAGEITVDGYSIFDIPYAWSQMMGYVPQTVYLMDDSIRNNVAFGDESIDDIDVWAALDKASLKKFVETLPDGLDTVVGEQGIKFSGGQRQRIAIARALYTRPDILILDEATSALDNETETAVMEAIESLQGSITMIIIAHRLTTIRNCDRIYRVEGGQAHEVDKEKIF